MRLFYFISGLIVVGSLTMYCRTTTSSNLADSNLDGQRTPGPSAKESGYPAFIAKDSFQEVLFTRAWVRNDALYASLEGVEDMDFPQTGVNKYLNVNLSATTVRNRYEIRLGSTGIGTLDLWTWANVDLRRIAPPYYLTPDYFNKIVADQQSGLTSGYQSLGAAPVVSGDVQKIGLITALCSGPIYDSACTKRLTTIPEGRMGNYSGGDAIELSGIKLRR